jgi:hypothetical protein
MKHDELEMRDISALSVSLAATQIRTTTLKFIHNKQNNANILTITANDFTGFTKQQNTIW